jgi:enoyl-CoA hydratase/carnithine racemase
MDGYVEYETIKTQVHDGVGILTFNRPQVMNAHNYQMKREVEHAADALAVDERVQALIVTGAGRGFHAGEDIKDVFRGPDREKFERDRIRALVGQADSGKWTGRVNPEYFLRYPKPTIAAVNGPAVGAGMSIALSCDVRIASVDALFGYTYTARGLMGTGYGLVALVHTIGLSRTMEVALSGAPVSAAEAAEMGLVSRVVPAAVLQEEAKRTATRMMTGAPLAQRAIKETLYRALLASTGIDDYSERTAAALGQTADHREGTLAFMEKRSPKWTGS